VRAAGSPRYKMSDSLLYVSNFVANTNDVGDVAVYDARANNPSPVAVITNGIDQPGVRWEPPLTK
jgi:hypothetical protein